MTPSLLVASNAKPNKEDAYIDWYRTRHLPDMLKLHGVEGGELCRALPDNPSRKWGVVTLYSLSDPLTDVLERLFATAGSAAMPMTDTVDNDSVLMLQLEPYGERRIASQTATSDTRAYYIVFSNAVSGQESAFHDWYDNQHLGDVLAVPGMVAAQRFRLSPATARQPSPWEWLAIYELTAGREAESIGELRRRAGTDRMPMSAALDLETLHSQLFRTEATLTRS